MDVGGNLKAGLFVGLIVSIGLYHVGNLVKNQYFQSVGDLYSLINLIQLAISIITFFFIIYNKLIARLILRVRYIGGKYEGKSTHFAQEDQQFSIERFTITQNLFEMTVSGKSFYEGNESHHSVWTGRLFKIEGNTYYFGLEVATQAGEMGVLRLTIDDGNANGFYYSGKIGTKHAYTFWAKQIKPSLSNILSEVFQW